MSRRRSIEAATLRRAAYAERWDRDEHRHVRAWLNARADEAERSRWPKTLHEWHLWSTGRWGA